MARGPKTHVIYIKSKLTVREVNSLYLGNILSPHGEILTIHEHHPSLSHWIAPDFKEVPENILPLLPVVGLGGPLGVVPRGDPTPQAPLHYL